MRKFLTSVLLIILLFNVAILYAQEGGLDEVEDAAGDVVEQTEGIAETTADTAQDLFDRVTEQPRSGTARIVLLIGGLILLLIGWRIYEFIILLASFVIGATFAVSLLDDPNTVLMIASLIIGGVVGMFVGGLVYYAAVFFIGAFIGINLANGLAALLDIAPISSLALVVAGVIGGVILVSLSFELLVLLAAVVGAQMVALALDLGSEWTIVLAVGGIVLQIAAIRRSGRKIRRRPVRRNLIGMLRGRS